MRINTNCITRLEARTIVDTRKCPEWGAKDHGGHTNAEYLYTTTREVDHQELHWQLLRRRESRIPGAFSFELLRLGSLLLSGYRLLIARRGCRRGLGCDLPRQGVTRWR